MVWSGPVSRRCSSVFCDEESATTTFVHVFDDDQLFKAAGTGWFYLVLPSPSSEHSIELADAWSNPTLRANFVYSTGELGITADNAAAFVSAVIQRVASSGATRGFLWMRKPDAWRVSPQLTVDSAPLMGMNADGTAVETGLRAPILPGATMTLANLSGLAFANDAVTISGAVDFSGPRAPVAASPALVSTLALDGDARGTLRFSMYLQRQSLNDAACWGFQFLFPAPPQATQPAVYEWLPLADASPPNAIGFDIAIDPSDPANGIRQGDTRPIRSTLSFSGLNNDGTTTTLQSRYATTYGLPVGLTPIAGESALVFNGGVATSDTQQKLQLAPMGSFTLTTSGTAPMADLLCGLHGTELISFQPGQDRLRFTPYMPAFAPRYPFPEVSSVGPPVDLQASLLDDTYTTSWATVVRAPGTSGSIPYVAQPKGASLYGHDPLVWPQDTQLMGWLDPADTLPDDGAFPLVPYSGVTRTDTLSLTFSAQQTDDFERQVIGPTRRKLIGSNPADRHNSRALALGLARSADNQMITTTTPTGLIATVRNGTWTQILLGQNLEPPQMMYFCNPSASLQQAFQTGQLFLVVANATNVGTFMSGGTGACGTSSQFFNTMEIGGWKLTANVGVNNRYDDYRNVLIVKGRKGKLFDPVCIADSLVANPDKWTQKDTFAAPSDLMTNPSPPPPDLLRPPDASELTILAQWLQNYFSKAADVSGEDLAKFNAIATNENWTGILVLRMDITGVPSDLAGITAGISDETRFNAHHFGIEISQVTNEPGGTGPTIDDTSSMFGLIDYVDPGFVPPPQGAAPEPVAPAPGLTYDFRVLQLKVLFANTAVRTFQSYVQLTTASWFDMPVARMGEAGNPYAALVLRGALQNNSGQPVYSLSAASDATFYFANDVVNKIEITSATMSTRNDGSAPGAPVVSWVSMTGFLDFRVVEAMGNFAFDIFSFGAPADDPDQPRRGLSFSNLGISMSFPIADPAARAFAFETGGIRFDLATSTPRRKSLFQEFALGIKGLVQGTQDAPPSKGGYTNVVTDARLDGVDGGPWWGINYQLSMGTPGDLAGKAGLVSSLLTAWSPQISETTSPSGYKAMVGLQLPGTGGGAKLISLQNVLKLSLGQVLLRYDTEKQAFLLLFTEIGLKLFGLLSIPPGSTLFYLFGNPESDGDASGLGWYAMYRKKKPD